MIKVKADRGPIERHFATALEDGSVMTFECQAGHEYKVDLARKKHQATISELWWRRMLRYWSRSNGGVSAQRFDCPKCRCEARNAAKKES